MSASELPESRQAASGTVFAFLAAVGFSVKAIFVKLGYTYAVDAVTLLALRMLFALPFFMLMALWSLHRNAPRLSSREWFGVVTLGLLGYYLASLLDFWGLVYISASLERLILFMYPTLVVLLSAAFLRRRIDHATVAALVLCYIGIALVLANDIEPERKNLVLGAALVFASVVAYALYLVGSGELISRVGTLRFASYATTVACIAVIVQFALTRNAADLIQPLPVYGFGLAMAVLSTVLPVVLLTAAIRRIGAGPAAIIGSVGPVSTLVLAAVFLGESLSRPQWLGAALVIAGAVLASANGKPAVYPPVVDGASRRQGLAPGSFSGVRMDSWPNAFCRCRFSCLRSRVVPRRRPKS
jgi:drug/metabolite transporter (DMT)-like permease